MPAGVTTDAAGEIEVASTDVVRLMLQFASENGLTQTFQALQEETGVSLNTVPSKEALAADVRAGSWDKVLGAVDRMTLPRYTLFDLYEHIVLEMLEAQEMDLVRRLLRRTDALQLMARVDADRFARLDNLAGRSYWSAKEAFPEGKSKESRRADIADALAKEVTVVPGGRLLTLLGHAVKWQRYVGSLPPGDRVDLFKGVAQGEESQVEAFPTTLSTTIKFGKKSPPEVAAFSPDAAFFVTGSIDGFVEVWNVVTGKIRKDLTYQKEQNYMSHDAAVLALAFSDDGALLASACQDAVVKVWRCATGECLRRFDKAHAAGITCVSFSADNAQVLTGSFDATARVHGIRSGKIAIKEYRGHSSYVNSAAYAEAGAKVVTASSDGTVRVWDARGMETLHTISPAPSAVSDPPPCYSAARVPGTTLLAVCTRTPYVTLVSLDDGRVVKQFSSGKTEDADFVACSVSPKGYARALHAHPPHTLTHTPTHHQQGAPLLRGRGRIPLLLQRATRAP